MKGDILVRMLNIMNISEKSIVCNIFILKKSVIIANIYLLDGPK